MDEKERIEIVEEELDELTLTILLDLRMNKKTTSQNLTSLYQLLDELKHLTYKKNYMKKSLCFMLYDLEQSVKSEMRNCGREKDVKYIEEIFLKINESNYIIFSDKMYEWEFLDGGRND